MATTPPTARCTACGGTGAISWLYLGYPRSETCWCCDGTGERPEPAPVDPESTR